MRYSKLIVIFISISAGVTGAAFGQSSKCDELKAINTPNATVVNAPKVGIDTAKRAAQVGNASSKPVPVIISATAKKPFQAYVDLNILPGGNTDFADLAIPAGKRLVIENVSAVTTGPIGQDLLVSVGSILKYAAASEGSGGFEDFDLVLASQGITNGTESLAGDQKVLIFADESVITDSSVLRGLGVSVELSRGDLSGNAAARVSISGYVEDLPAVQ